MIERLEVVSVRHTTFVRHVRFILFLLVHFLSHTLYYICIIADVKVPNILISNALGDKESKHPHISIINILLGVFVNYWLYLILERGDKKRYAHVRVIYVRQ